MEETEGSSDKYLVVSKSIRNKNIISFFDMIWRLIEKLFNSDIDLPLDTLIEFHSLVINVSCVIEKDNKYYPKIYLDECL